MPFSFGFGGDDIDEGDTHAPEHRAQEPTTKISPMTAKPRKWTLKELLSTLPSQITYNTLQLSPEGTGDRGNVQIARRSLFDIRTQLMAEANADDNDNDKLLKGLDDGDLTSGLYEGGFKTWECAVDLAEEVAKFQFNGHWHIIELGAGSAVPSLALLQTTLRGVTASDLVRFTLCDYNEDVLKLCTLPNVLLSCLLESAVKAGKGPDDGDHDFDLEAMAPYLNNNLERQLYGRGIEIDFVSGAWGTDFVSLLQDTFTNGGSEHILILASETIYSVESIEVFTSTIMELLKLAKGSAQALVAAKKVYFGVGGGTDEFVRCVCGAGGKVEVLSHSMDTGVGRIILKVTAG